MYVFRRLLSNRVILIDYIIKVGGGVRGVDQNMIFDDKGGRGSRKAQNSMM